MRALLLAAIATITLVGCVGELDTNGGTGDDTGSGSGSGNPPPVGSGSGSAADTARIYFNTNVYTFLSQTCGAAGCHNATTPGGGAPPFVNQTSPNSDDHAAWNTITGLSQVVGTFTSTAPILTVPGAGTHFAQFTSDQAQAITAWLGLEAAWRSAAGSGSTPVDLLAQWSGCMQLTDFNAADNNTGMAQAWANRVQTGNGDTCGNCHVNGTGTSYFIATPSPTNMFGTISTEREYLSTFFTIDTTKTPNQVVINTIPFKLASEGLSASGQHEEGWNPTNNEGMTALTDFYNATMAHLTANACGPSTLAD